MKMNILAQTKQKIKNQALYNANLVKSGKHLNAYDRIEQEYYEGVHEELETLKVLGEAVKDFCYKDDTKEALIVKIEIRGKSNIHRIIEWLYESSR